MLVLDYVGTILLEGHEDPSFDVIGILRKVGPLSGQPYRYYPLPHLSWYCHILQLEMDPEGEMPEHHGVFLHSPSLLSHSSVLCPTIAPLPACFLSVSNLFLMEFNRLCSNLNKLKVMVQIKPWEYSVRAMVPRLLQSTDHFNGIRLHG